MSDADAPTEGAPDADAGVNAAGAAVRDLLGIGLGPFNLGLSALIDGHPEIDLDAVFLEQDERFAWHEGMLIEGTTLEVPFLADLVTLADPTSPYSYLNYLRERGRLYEFYFYERFQIPRREYDDYCRWVAERVDDARFGQRVVDVRPAGAPSPAANFRVEAVDPASGERSVYRCRDLVVGVGSRPYVPEGFRDYPDEEVFHTADYLRAREAVLDAAPDGITVVGSGQSAAEVFEDLLERQPDGDYRLDWLTRSDGFFPMEYSKLGLQHFTPEYVQYFYDLPQPVRDDLLPEQDLLYKGIDPDTSDSIYETLYEHSVGRRSPDVGMLATTEVRAIERTSAGRYRLDCEQHQTGTRFAHESDVVVLGTGYHRPTPAFLSALEPRIERDEHGRLAVGERYALRTTDLDGRVFVQNAEVHTHGVGAPDLGLGTYRNSAILDRLLDESPYPVDEDTVYQDFAAEAFVRDSPSSALRDPETPDPADD
jgi:lysine N6-hydroxylase